MTAIPRTYPAASVPAASVVLLVAGLAVPASAGNIAPIVIEQEPVVAETVWAGLYAGARLGYGFDGDDEVGHRTPAGRLVASPGRLEIDGVSYGLRLGWRGEVSLGRPAFVYGVELGYDGGGIEDSFTSNGYAAKSELNDLLGLRLKLGRTDISRQTLFYGILGYVRGDFDYSVAGATGGDAIALQSQDDYDGFSVGLGVEHRLTDRMSLTAEWEYLDFGDQTLTDGVGATTKATPSFKTINIGLNYRF